MSSSIIAGINNVNPDSAGILISLVDHYYLNTTLINELIFKFKAESNKVIVSRYSDNKIGPPVIFPKSYYPMLKELKGDKGAGVIINTLLKNDPNKIQLIDFPNGHLDLDTPEDLNNLNL